MRIVNVAQLVADKCKVIAWPAAIGCGGTWVKPNKRHPIIKVLFLKKLSCPHSRSVTDEDFGFIV